MNAQIHTLAEAQAKRCLLANLAALGATQKELAESLAGWELPPVTWLLGRDGSLTAQDAEGRWIGGTSLPLRVGRALLGSLELKSPVGCFLQPTTAGEIRAALEIIGPSQAIVVVLPEESRALIALHCDDFSEDIRKGRVWFACGAEWGRHLADLLKSNPGLCIPGQYIRTGLLGEGDLAAISPVANSVIASETNRRVELMRELSESSPSPGNPGEGGGEGSSSLDDREMPLTLTLSRSTVRRSSPQAGRGDNSKSICVVAGSAFRLWDMAGPVLARTLAAGGARWRRVDTDQPLSASPLALAMAARECGAVVVADVYRADLPGTVSNQVPWITWATKPRFVAPSPEAAGDAVLLAEGSWRDLAAGAGWARSRIGLAGWPTPFEPLTNVPAEGALALIADAVVGEAPESFRDLSSLGTLWDYVAAEMAADPLAVGNDTDQYLLSRAEKLEVAADKVDRGFFTQTLLIPAWRRGVARLLMKAGLPLVVFGEGWDQESEFAACWGGGVTSLEDLRRVASVASAVVHPVPGTLAHPIDAIGRRVVRPAARRDLMVQQARMALAGKTAARAANSAVLSPTVVLSLLSENSSNR